MMPYFRLAQQDLCKQPRNNTNNPYDRNDKVATGASSPISNALAPLPVKLMLQLKHSVVLIDAIPLGACRQDGHGCFLCVQAERYHRAALLLQLVLQPGGLGVRDDDHRLLLGMQMPAHEDISN